MYFEQIIVFIVINYQWKKNTLLINKFPIINVCIQ
jgi:hypothetical protein